MVAMTTRSFFLSFFLTYLQDRRRKKGLERKVDGILFFFYAERELGPLGATYIGTK